MGLRTSDPYDGFDRSPVEAAVEAELSAELGSWTLSEKAQAWKPAGRAVTCPVKAFSWGTHLTVLEHIDLRNRDDHQAVPPPSTMLELLSRARAAAAAALLS